MSAIVAFVTAPAVWPLLAAVVILTLGLSLVLYRWGGPDRFSSRRAGIGSLVEFGPVFICVALVAICTGLVWRAYAARVAMAADISRSILPGFFASLLEDLFFFSAVGFVIFVVQRREFERGRNIDDRLDTLFNAKSLTSEELTFLKEQVRAIGCDFRRNDMIIDVQEYDAVNNCVRLDVIRRWSVASYFQDESAEYHWEIDLIPDDIAGVTPLMEIYPTQRRTLHLGPKKRWASEVVELHPAVVLSTPERFRQALPIERVEPDTVWEFRLRYRAWQMLTTAAGLRDPWQFTARKHWDTCSVRVRNSLSRAIRVHVEGKESRTVDLGAGAEQIDALELSNLTPGSTIEVSFTI